MQTDCIQPIAAKLAAYFFGLLLMRALSISLILAATCGLAQGADLKPVTAVYTVMRDGKAVGDATYNLAPNGDGTWTLHSATKGSAGMAKLVGLDVRENSTFQWRDGKPQGVRYDYKQDAAIKHKDRTIDFDWTAQRANVVDNGKNFSYALPANTIDRSTVALTLGMMLADGAHEATLAVAAKDHVEQQRYQVRGTEKIDVPAGSFQAVHIERTDVQGKASSWYAPNVATLPVRVEQVQGDGSTIVMDLKQR